MRCLLSIDAGGTKCQTIVVKEDGSLVGCGRCGFPDSGSCEEFGGSGRSAKSVNGAIIQAMHGVECTELHVVSYHQQGSLEDVLGSGFKIIHHPLHESGGILELANLKFGLIASAGTGSFVHVVGEDGSRLHLDSLGPLLGDYGSAYHVGLLAIQAAAKCDWHPRHQTSLKEVVYLALDIEEAAGRGRGTALIGVFDRVKDRAVIADLARLVNEEAQHGDAIANAILNEAASALAQTVYDAYDRLPSKDGYCLVGTGGLIENSDIYWQHVCECVREFAPDLKCVRTDLPHVVGTALSALHNIANGDLATARERLIAEAKQVFRPQTKELSQ